MSETTLFFIAIVCVAGICLSYALEAVTLAGMLP